MGPFLPPELERDIFECAALSHKASIPAFLRVARRIYAWIHPLLYRTLMVKTNSEPWTRFLKTIQSMGPDNSEFLQSSLQNLFVHNSPWLSTELHFVLSSCNSLTNFVIMSTNPSILPLLETKRLKRITVSLAQLFDNGSILQNLPHPAFMHATHLDLIDFLHKDKSFDALTLLPALTHLCLNSFVHRRQLQIVFAGCKGLRVLVNMHTEIEPEWGLADICGRLAIEDEPRFVLMAKDHSHNNFARDWEAGRRGEKDFWILAEEFVEKKRKGQIVPGECIHSKGRDVDNF
ncbi:hypothetical protein FB45DRAFT_141661 [Roridomyces roridus]|uniref:Uncharacterized protein n=1 Tax=Roridomyces roridus TaxID=1738132 RepID=A0AAD7BI33_9AGAR|nr:hypothetical protein FB45DRAFT_432517 [Roridomyces roridus]KAJ7621484.1 hypothetical protein FB45DRAFT_141661 [Roridomyces roridus]